MTTQSRARPTRAQEEKMRAVVGNGRLHWEFNKLPSKADRDKYGEMYPIAKAALEASRKARDARAKVLMDADPDYQRLVQEVKDNGTRVVELGRYRHADPCRIGTIDSVAGFGAFFVSGTGENWEEAIEAARQAKARDAERYKRK